MSDADTVTIDEIVPPVRPFESWVEEYVQNGKILCDLAFNNFVESEGGDFNSPEFRTMILASNAKDPKLKRLYTKFGQYVQDVNAAADLDAIRQVFNAFTVYVASDFPAPTGP